MGRVFLCMGRYAKTPYRFDSVCMNVYCIEELCYLLVTNPFMIDAGIVNEKLADWIDRECGLQELSHQLLTVLNRGCQPSVYVNVILDYTGFCSKEDRAKMESILQDSVGLSGYEKLKKQGDYLVKNGKYQLAIQEYDRLLLQLPESDNSLRPQLYHNLGVAYSHLFLFESAQKYFKKAYELTGSEEVGIQYLAAMRQMLTPGEYVSFIAGHGELYELSLKVEKLYDAAMGQFEATRENRMLSALKIYKEEGNTVSYYEEIDRIIASLKNSYREEVTQ